MKKNYFFSLLLIITLSVSSPLWSQISAAGDIAFTAINTDGDDDFAIVTLVDISANTTVYFTDKSTDGSAFTDSGSDGFLIWNTGASIITAGTIVVFTDTDNSTNPKYGASIGTLSSPENVILVATGETLFAYLGTDQFTPTTFLAGIKNALLDVGELNGTGLTEGTNFLQFNPTTSPDGGYYSGSRSSETVYSNYLAIINNKTNWNHETTDGELILPISTSNFTMASTTWTGTSSTDWNTVGNWSNGIPTSSLGVIIPLVINMPVINTVGTTCVDLTIDTGSTLTINAGKSLTVSNNLTNNGTFTVNSDVTTSGSLIIKGTSTGNITYNRFLTSGTSTKWHLIAAPVIGQDIDQFITTVSNDIASSGINFSLTPYDNSYPGTNPWHNHWTAPGAGNFISGKGYEILTTADGNVVFTGTVATANVSIPITVGTKNAWNLVGNPFPSSIPANTNADAINNFITVNSAAMDASFVALYFWNPTTSLYDLINQATTSTFIAPGQGFFVKSISGGGTVNFTTAMRINQSTVAFQRAATPATPSVTLIANNGSTTKTTNIKYMGATSLGLDPGYDAGRFGGVNTNFDVFTHLVTDNGVDFALQVLPDNVYDTTVIPIGIEAKAGTQITFKAIATNLPLNKKVFLEDRLLGVFKELNTTNKTYSVNLSKNTNGIGRFYLHTQNNQSTLIGDINQLNFSLIAQPNLNSIRIIGNIDQPAKLNIYDTLGRLIQSHKLNISTDQNINVSTMSSGIYIVKIKGSKNNFSTKIAWY